MKLMSPEKMREKTSIAWFKLAEVIMRGEKERTLSIYRLLMHSVQHEAVKTQLEGDILHMFNDPNALQSYVKAAGLYQKENDLLQAMILYEQVINMYVMRDQTVQAYDFIGTLLLSSPLKAKLFERLLVQVLLSGQPVVRAFAEKNVAAILTGYMSSNDPAYRDAISRFLARLSSLDEGMHAYACSYLTSI